MEYDDDDELLFINDTILQQKYAIRTDVVTLFENPA
jgi:hypothetical protein